MHSRTRWRTRICIYSFLSLFILFYSGCQPIQIGEPEATSTESAPTKKSGQIAKDETWSGNILVDGDLVITGDAALIITSGTTVKFAKDTGLIVEGNLYAEGQANRAIVLTSAEADPKPGDWKGIVFTESCQDSRMEYCVVEFHSKIVCRTDSLNLTYSIIASGKDAGIVCEASSPIIEDNKITKNGVGIICEDSASPKINHNTITTNTLDGIQCEKSSFPTISNNLISNNLKNGISCYSGSSPEISSNNIMFNGGWAIYGGGKLRRNFIQGNRELGMDAIDASNTLSAGQHYGVESIESPRSSRIRDAGIRTKERW